MYGVSERGKPVYIAGPCVRCGQGGLSVEDKNRLLNGLASTLNSLQGHAREQVNKLPSRIADSRNDWRRNLR